MSDDGGFSNEDYDAAAGAGKARPKGHIPYLPSRDASFSVFRQFVSLGIGLPAQVRLDGVIRQGRDEDSPLVFAFSNGQSIRCDRQKRLQSARSFGAFWASQTDGMCRPMNLSNAEVLDVYTAICILGTVAEDTNELEALSERLDMFVALCEPLAGAFTRDQRYLTVQSCRARQLYDPHNSDGRYPSSPVMVVNGVKRYVRHMELATYLREVHGQRVDEHRLPSLMSELGGERFPVQAWAPDRSHKVHLVFYELPPEREGDSGD